MKLKKLVSVALAGAMAFSLTACGGSDTAATTAAAKEEAKATEAAKEVAPAAPEAGDLDKTIAHVVGQLGDKSFSDSAETGMKTLREEGYKVGVIRPITLWPFPVKAFQEAKNAKAFLSVEMSMGQMVEDIKLATECRTPVYFFGRTGGIIPTPEEIIEEVKKIAKEIK